MTAGCSFSCRPRWTGHLKHLGKVSNVLNTRFIKEATRAKDLSLRESA